MSSKPKKPARPKTMFERLEDLERRQDQVELDLEVLWEEKERRDREAKEAVGL